MPTQATPRLTAAEVVAIAQRVLQADNWAYDPAHGLRPTWRGQDADVPGRAGQARTLWNVAFTTPADPFNPVDRVLAIDDETGEPVYILLGPGRHDFLSRAN